MTLNLERRAQAVFNVITIVPGAASAWYRQDLIDSGGFSSRTLAEDSDMTISLLRDGGKIIFVEEAVAYTTAPQCVKDLIIQRTRWSYGNAQCILLHWKEILSKSNWKLKYVGFPNYILSNSLTPFIPILLISLNLLLYIHGSIDFLLIGNFILLTFEIGKIILGLFLDPPANLANVYSVSFYLVTFPFIHLVSFLRGGGKRSAGIMFEWRSKGLKSKLNHAGEQGIAHRHK
jgi:cellulose synthase/poly-beta-1,6-N-acetylglucosamine synthase-like glycosyltransferase